MDEEESLSLVSALLVVSSFLRVPLVHLTTANTVFMTGACVASPHSMWGLTESTRTFPVTPTPVSTVCKADDR